MEEGLEEQFQVFSAAMEERSPSKGEKKNWKRNSKYFQLVWLKLNQKRAALKGYIGKKAKEIEKKARL